jgi:predicted nucleic acid-binding protein
VFAQRVLAITEDVMFRWRLMVAQGRKVGHTYLQPDLTIAATAFHHSSTLVMRDGHDHKRTGIRLYNPWTDLPPP